MVKPMPNPQYPKGKMPRSQNAGKFAMSKPEVGINVQKGFPMPKKVRQHKRF